MGVHSVSSGVVAFMATGIHIKSIHVLRWLDLEFCVFFGEAQKRFRVLGSARTREQRASAEHDWVTDPALSPLFRQGAHRGSALRSLQHSDLVFRCETESHCHCCCLTVSSTRCRSSPDGKPTFGSAIASQPPADRSDALTHYCVLWRQSKTHRRSAMIVNIRHWSARIGVHGVTS
jgi:hypothetical protein